MKFSGKWLREWVDPEVSTAALADGLTLAGLEVAAVTPVASLFSGVEVAEIRAVEPHPEDGRLRVCSVVGGDGEPHSVVCGAPNTRPGLRVAWARASATLPEGRVVGRLAFGGVASEGMLCSAEELGIEDTSAGLLELPTDSPIGVGVWDLLGLDDQAVEVDLTPNRGDCLGIAGIAREIGVLFRRPVTPPAVRPVAAVIADVLEVRVLASAACPSYVGRIVRALDAQAHTPLWMRERLRRSGVRCLGPIVDVTNYVMLEWGQPMHAFDLARLGAPIEVRHARKGERITLLDGQELALTGETLVIADRNAAVAVAGIMGGHDTGVGPNTTDVFLESAFFAPAAVAGKARAYRLQTDSSHRFERGVDFEIQALAMERATALLIAICGGRPGPVVPRRAPEHLPARNAITLRAPRIRRLLGVDVPAQEVAEVLSRLGMSVAAEPGVAEAGSWRVQPPSFRFDLAIEADLIEELARVRGYERIPSRPPLGTLKMNPRPEAVLDTARLCQVLCDRGYHEAITYSFVDPVNLGRLMPGVETLPLANPIASDMSVMRPSLWPGLLGALKRNQDRQVGRVRLFEIGLVFRLADGKLDQCPKIGGVAWGPCVPEQWDEPRRSVDFFDVKNDVEALLALAGAGAEGGEVAFRPNPDAALQGLHRHQSAVVLRGRTEVGVIGALQPFAALGLGVQTPVYLFELDLGHLSRRELPVYRPLSRFPLVRRDLSLVVARDTTAAAVLGCIAGQAGDVLKEVRLFDVYHGGGLDTSEKSLAIGLIFQGISSTLIDADVDAFVERVVIRLQEALGARLRGQRSSD